MKLCFVTGKGGVGKTRVSLLLSKKDSQAALAETSVGVQIEAEKIGVLVPPVYRFSREDLAEDFLVSTLKIRAIARWLSRSSLFQTLLSLAPNLNELLLFQKWIELSQEQPLIVDAPSTGHFLAIFDAIKTAKVVFDGGSLRGIANDIDYFLKKNEIYIFVVSLPEQSALLEMKEIISGIKDRYPSFTIKTVLNRKHKKPKAELNLSEDLKDIAYRRVELEDERIKDHSFDYVLEEGGISL